MMNEAQREVLKKKHVELVQDIIVTEELLGICYQQKLFDSFMIDTIRSQPSSYQQAAKLLELLPRRGPDAFDKFLKILESGHSWLATMLRSSLKEMEKTANRTYLPKLEISGDKMNSPRAQFDNHSNSSSPEPSNPKIKELVEKFISKNFVLNRRMSQNDKKAVENFLIEQIEHSACASVDEVDNHYFYGDEKHSGPNQQWLHNMYIKLKVHIDALETRGSVKEMDKTTYTIDTVNTDVLEKQINFVLQQLETLDGQVSQVYNVLGDINCRRSLSLQFEDLIVKCNELTKDLEKEKQKMDKMTHEIYQLSMGKKKLEHNNDLKDIQLEVKENLINKMQHDNAQLKHEVDRLNHLNMQHLEKQKTLHNLREMVNELQDSKSTIKEENDNLKSKLIIRELNVSRKSVMSRKISAAKTITGKTNKFRATNRR